MNENTIAIWNTVTPSDRAELTDRVPISGSSSSSADGGYDEATGLVGHALHQTKTWTIDFHPSTTPRSNDH
jgi:hypothetical protein